MAYKMFVYGSLMNGFYNYEKYLEGKVLNIEKSFVIGSLYHIENKGYPGFVNEGSTKVYGETITYEEENLAKEIDELEEYVLGEENDNMYNKEKLVVYSDGGYDSELLNVYIYNENSYKNKDNKKVYVESGNWREYMIYNCLDNIRVKGSWTIIC